MQSDYTKKMQDISGVKDKAAAYEKYEQYLPIVEEMLAHKETNTQSNVEIAQLEAQLKEAGYSPEAVEMMKIGAGFILNRFNQTQQANEYRSWVGNQITEAGKADPRLNDPNLVYQFGDGESATFGQIVEELVAADAKWQEDPIAATNRAVKKVDAMLAKARVEGKEELSNQAKAKAKTFQPVNSSPQGATETAQPTTVHEAFELTKKQLGL